MIETKIAIAALLVSIFSSAAWGDSTSAWQPITSGPFYTGTAEAASPGSFFVETYLYDEYQSGLGTRTLTTQLSFDTGVGNGVDVGGLIPYQYTLQDSTIGWVHGGGIGDAELWGKKELVRASSKWPEISTEMILTLPAGNSSNFKPDLYGADQTGLGTTNLGISFLAHKLFEPYEFYAQVTYTVASAARVPQGYVTANGVTLSQPSEIAPGDTITYSAAFEQILNESNNLGYLVEIYGAFSRTTNLLRGPTDKDWSFLDVAPEVEVNSSRNVSWGAGLMMPVYQSNYPNTTTAMFTVTYSYDGKD